MNLQIAKWGNSLAVRLPVEITRQMGWTEGTRIEARLSPRGGVVLRSEKWDREAFYAKLWARLESMPITPPVVEEMRRQARY